ncbi:replication initiator protein [Blackfly microvirus SF02]|uniref:Replication initiator protein n=1 Tax=Blackfly microvirus SF02 TaxID=2576452 RepID=A0A4P8PPY0_9VIRU|nr:replication initiator protein [Blackfly microvirus SF02]
MSCYSPVNAWYSKVINPETGKRLLQYKPQGSLTGYRFKVGCGHCPGCLLERSRQWGIRAMHENRMHKQSAFLTLTYSNDTLPRDGSLVKRHLQLFHKKLHNRLLRSRGVGIRYYSCGEYGSLNQRPHYHVLSFGYDPPDKLLYSRNHRDEPIYSSRELDAMWGYGDTKVGEVTFESASYVARYCLKKVSAAVREAGHYVVYDADGVIHERLPEFQLFSTNPGIGSSYFDRYKDEIMAHDTIIMGNREVPSVRYYDKKIEAIDPLRYKQIKRNRVRKALLVSKIEAGPDRMRVKELLLLKCMKLKERNL